MPVLSVGMSSLPAGPRVVAGRYRLVEALGQGGMGRVWKARDEVLHRDVAIKEVIPPPGLTEQERQEMRERSLREARAIARLNHVNVVRVFDVLRTDGDPWIVMEYVPSRSLQDVLDTDGPVPPHRAAEIGLEVLRALQAAHQSGVVHRDVKPGNVLLGEDGRVVLTDFGLATVPGDPNVTRTGLVLGSPAYISPERARDGSFGPEADLWSLGATIFAAVEGQSPYARATAIATLTALASEPPPPALNASGPLRTVLIGLLRKEPAFRVTATEAERLLIRAASRPQRRTFLSGVRLSNVMPRRDRPRGADIPREPVQFALPAVANVPVNVPDSSAQDAQPTSAAGPVAGADAVPARDVESAGAGEPTSEGGFVTDVGSTTADAPSSAAIAPGPDARETQPDGTRLDLLWLDPPDSPAAEAAQTATPAEETPALPPAITSAGQTDAEARRSKTAVQTRLPGVRRLGGRLAAKRREFLVAGLATAAVMAVALIFPLLRGSGSGGDTPAATGTSAGASAPAPTTSPSAAATSSPAATASPTTVATTPSSFTLPAGWHTYTGNGYSIPVPDGWSMSSGGIIQFREPGGLGRILGISQSDISNPDPKAALAEQEGEQTSKSQYQQLKLAPLDYRGYPAAEWEWLYNTDRGTRIHALRRGFIAEGKFYTISWYVAESDWQKNLDSFNLVADGFALRRP